MVRSAWASPRRDEAPATPRHVLDLAESLQLSEDQRRHTQAISEDMRAEAVRLGQQLIARERHLETLFATGTVAETMVEQLVANIATGVSREVCNFFTPVPAPQTAAQTD